MAWDQAKFDAAFKNKENISQQQANADMIKANAAAANVAQQQSLQSQQDAAAMDRARVAADNSAMIAGMNNQASRDVTGMNNQSARDIAGLQNQGAMDRTLATTGTQRDIAGMENDTRRAGLSQAADQFGRTLALDTAKAQEQAIQSRGQLGVGEYGNPTLNPKTGALESTIKRPAITGLAPSSLNSLGSISGLSMESDEDLQKRRAAAAAAQ